MELIYVFSKIEIIVYFILTVSVQIFALVLSWSRLSLQDDSEDEPHTAKRAHGRSDALEFIDLSCEEGEETASSEVHTDVTPCQLSCGFAKNKSHLQACVVFLKNLFRTTSWMAVKWIPPMMKNGTVTAHGITFIARTC